MSDNENKTTPDLLLDTGAEQGAIDVANDLQQLISASSSNTAPSEKIDFSIESDQVVKEKKKMQAIKAKEIPKKIVILLSIAVVLGLLALVVSTIYQLYLYAETGKSFSLYTSYMPKIEKNYLYLTNVLGIQNTEKYGASALSVQGRGDNEGVVQSVLTDPTIDYVVKKKTMKGSVGNLYKASEQSYMNLAAIKAEVGQQGYFPKGVQALAKGVFFDNSLQKAIISIESLRFTTALKFFTVLDSFLTQLSSVTSASKTDLQAELEKFIERGEKDINNYIASCYLNGYEISSNCNTIGDFSNYYVYSDLAGFNQRLFLQTMERLQSKLENTDFPSLEIAMRSIDPLTNTISLSVEVNTFKEDEAQLTETKGILNPHIFLVTQLIKHLRESRFILADSINLNGMQVTKKRIKIGGQIVPVNSSSFTFNLPLQNDVQREIYDFVEQETTQ